MDIQLQLQTGNIVALPVLVLLVFSSLPIYADPIFLTIDEPATENPHVHDVGPAGATLDIAVTATDPKADVTLILDVFDGLGRTVAADIVLPPQQTIHVFLPSHEPRHYNLQARAEGPDKTIVSFDRQEPGYPSSLFGISVTHPSAKEKSSEPRFCVVHGIGDDPTLSGAGVQTLTWNTHKDPAKFAAAVKKISSQNKQEIPALSGDGWEFRANDQEDQPGIPAAGGEKSTSDDAGEDVNRPVTAEFLQALDQRFTRYLKALEAAGEFVPVWRAGREENRGDWPGLFGIDNYIAKVTTMREALDREGWQASKIAVHMRANSPGQEEEIRKLLQHPKAVNISIVGISTYHWWSGNRRSDPEDFPPPLAQGKHDEPGWFPTRLMNLQEIIRQTVPDAELAILEVGVPFNGTTSENGNFGYARSNGDFITTRNIPQAEAGLYIAEIFTLARAADLYTTCLYNFFDRGNDPSYPEDNFGMRSYVADSSKKLRASGYTKSTYLAWKESFARLGDHDTLAVFRKVAIADTELQIFEFQDANRNGKTVVTWLYPVPSAPVQISLGTIFPDPSFSPAAVIEMVDHHGTPLPEYKPGDTHFTLDGNMLLYMEINDE